MNFLGNLIWALTGGIICFICWLVAGILWCCTIIGIPVGLQCFKLSLLSLCPFGREIQNNGKFSSFILNIIWICISGIDLCVLHLVLGLILCITIIGIPFGKQHFKLAMVALMPFGTSV